jgi:hypothetical protein
MYAHRIRVTAVVLAAIAALGASAAVAGPAAVEEGPLTSEQLIYQGAPTEVQVDVNGEAAVQLIGGVLDAAADIAQEQTAAMARSGDMPVPPQIVAIAAPLIEPAKNAIKSITRVSFVVMDPTEPVDPEAALTYYQDLMTSRGWIPMVTVRADADTRICALLAPGGKGVFAAVIPGSDDEMVVAMITTTEPLGDLIAQIVRAGGGKILPMIMSKRQAVARAEVVTPQAPEQPTPEG